MLRLALIGYGQMGRIVEEIAKSRQHEIAAVFDVDCPLRESSDLSRVDVCIDFSVPSAVLGNIQIVCRQKKNLVVGTTGWFDHLPEVEQWLKSSNTGLIYAANFSLGINLFYQVVENACQLMNRFEDYDVYIHETHHRHKIDSPSGTALYLSHIVTEHIDRKRDIHPDKADGKILPHQLHVTSTRVGSTPGTHCVGFDSDADTITLTHAARNRRGFARGAVIAAEWIFQKQGLFTMHDLLQSMH